MFEQNNGLEDNSDDIVGCGTPSPPLPDEQEVENNQSAAQHQFLLYEEHTRYQQQQINHFNQNAQLNTDYIASLMGDANVIARPGAQLAQEPVTSSTINNRTISSSSQHTSATAAAPIDPAGSMQQMDPTMMIAMMEAQRRNVNVNHIFNPSSVLQSQQFQSQQYQQKQHQMDAANAAAAAATIHNQMLLNQQHQASGLLQQQHDPLALGNMLHQARGVGSSTTSIPNIEPHSLFSPQIASRIGMVATNPLVSAPAYQRRIIDPEEEFKLAGNRGIIEPFPEKLHRLLKETKKAGLDTVISFTVDGKAFEIHMPDRFFKEIIPKYFKQSRLSSFKRQLNLYGFELIATGPTSGGYSHKHFREDLPELCRLIRRQDIKLKSSRRSESSKWDMNSPNFYNMPPIKASDGPKVATANSKTIDVDNPASTEDA